MQEFPNTIRTLRSVKVPGWDGDIAALPSWPEEDLAIPTDLEDFVGSWPTDRMAVMYDVPNEENNNIPRMNLPAVGVMRENGRQLGIRWVFLDFDNANHGAWSSNQAAIEFMDALPFDEKAAPSKNLLYYAGYYTTRAGFRLCWKLSDYIPVDRANSFLRNFTKLLLQQHPVLKSRIDESSWSWSRLFRTPCATRDGQELWSYCDMDGMTPIDPLSLPSGMIPDHPDYVGDVVKTDMPDTSELPELLLEDWAFAHELHWLRAGRPIPPDSDGHTYYQLKRVIASIAARGNISDPLRLLAYVAASVSATPDRTMQEAWSLACWVAARESVNTAEATANPDMLPDASSSPDVAGEEHAGLPWLKVQQALTGKYNGLAERLRAGEPLSTSSTILSSRTFEVMRRLSIAIPDATAEEIYATVLPTATTQRQPTPEALWRRARELTAERVASPMTLCKLFAEETPLFLKVVGTNEMFAWNGVTGGYDPCDKDTALLRYERFIRPYLPRDLELRGIDIRDLLTDFGADVVSVAYESGESASVYDPDTQELRIGIHALVPVEPREDKDIAGWLRLLAGDNDADERLLLSWLATAHLTQRPTCALFIVGDGGVGKTFFSKLVASMWGTSFIKYDELMASFQEGFTESPVILADEGITVSRSQQHRASEDFRALVANRIHRVDRKFKSTAAIYGCARVIVTGNQDDAIGFTKALSQEAVEAVTTRIAILRPAKGTKAYLQALDGGNGTEELGWIGKRSTPGKFAQHVAWLRENYTPARGSRLLVEGLFRPWHRQFATNQGLRPIVAYIVARLLDGVFMGQESARVKVDMDARVCYIAPRVLFDAWSEFNEGSKKPSMVHVRDGIKALSKPGVEPKRILVKGRGGGHFTHYPIDLQVLVDLSYISDDIFTQTEPT